jgi:dihydroorotase
MLIEKVTHGPRAVLRLEQPVIDVEAKANLTLLDPNRTWTLDEKTNLSKSKNSPWFKQTLTGKTVAVFNNDKQWVDL